MQKFVKKVERDMPAEKALAIEIALAYTKFCNGVNDLSKILRLHGFAHKGVFVY